MPRPPILPPWPDIEKLKADKGLSTDREVAEHFGVTEQAVAKRRKVWLAQQAGEQQTRARKFPWKIALEHSSGPIYRAALAYQNWKAGTVPSAADWEKIQFLTETARELDMAVSYDHDRGFYWTPRKAEDGDEMFVVR